MIPRWTLKEWMTTAMIAPEVGHLFVEGASDARALSHALGYPRGLDIRAAEEIATECESTPLCGGYKARLFRMANEVRANPKIENIRCLADRDFGELVSLLDSKPPMYFTEFANMPAATLTENWLSGFLLKGFGLVLTGDLWKQFLVIIRFSFIARYLSATENPKAAPSISDFTKYDNPVLRFDKAGYIKQYFGGGALSVTEKVSEIDDFASWITCDQRNTANSNDVFDLIHFLLRETKKIGGAFPRDGVRAAFLAAADVDIASQPTLAGIAEWAEIFRK